MGMATAMILLKSMTMMVMMMTLGKEIDCGVCGWVACGWSDYGRGFTVLCFDSLNLFQIKSGPKKVKELVILPQICFRLKVGREKIKELAIIQTGGNAVVLTEEIM